VLGASGLERVLKPVLAIAFVVGMSSAALAADDDPWSISKSSGDVWVASAGADQVALSQEVSLKPGDTIRTGQNGRVLLTRGEETMLISPNSVVGLPTDKRDGMSTTILQQAGSILLEVEKRNVKHFEVETPYLAAVVKGTQFRVTVNSTDTKVEVSRGQVEVSAFKSGQVAQILPGQTATAFAHGFTGLKLSGPGNFAPIEQGRPRASSIDRVLVPKGGLQAPPSPKGSSIRALAPFDKSLGQRAMAKPPAQGDAAGSSVRVNVVRISAPLGEVKLNVAKATHGLAHGAAGAGAPKLSSGNNDSMWGDAKSTAGAGSVAQAGSGSGANSGGGSASAQGGGGGSAGGGGVSAGGGGASGGVVGTTVTGVVGAATGAVGAASGVVGSAAGTVEGVLSGVTGNNGLHLGWGIGNGNAGKTH
jgi:FecR-like protein